MRYRSAAAPSPDDRGLRVTVRYRRSGEAGQFDVIGTLERLDEGTVTIRNRHGEAVEIPRAAIVAYRVVGRAAGKSPEPGTTAD